MAIFEILLFESFLRIKVYGKPEGKFYEQKTTLNIGFGYFGTFGILGHTPACGRNNRHEGFF